MTATGGSTPALLQERVTTAMPPTFAGVIRLANDPDSCDRNVGQAGSRRGTDPASDRAAPT